MAAPMFTPTLSSNGLPAESLGAVHDARREEDHELATRVRGAASLKEQTENWYVPEEGHLVEVAAGVSREDAADDRGMSVHDQQIGLCFAFQDGRIAAGRSLVEVGLVAVDLDVHGHTSVGGDVGAHQEL